MLLIIDDEDEIFVFFFLPVIVGTILYFVFRRKCSPFICFFIGFVFQWIVLINVNPNTEGIDSKYTIMQQMPKKYCPETQFLLSDISNQTYSFPIIIKPTINSGNGRGIVVVRSQIALNSFLDTCEEPGEYMVQNYLDDHPIEIGVLYEHMPWSDKGHIIDIGEKTEKSEIRSSVDGIFDISHLITPELDDEFRRISANIPGFYVGRYDIRLKRIDDLHKMEFKIVEVNGAFGSGLSYYCYELYKDVIFHLFQWYMRRIILGVYNIVSFRGYSPIQLPMIMMKTYYNMFHYNSFFHLFYLSS
jgi:hypothetical protein